MFWFVLALAASYLVGGIPTALIVGKLLRGIDVREYGSKNAGATNAWRVLGPKPGITVLAIDAAKGVVAVLLLAEVAAIPLHPVAEPQTMAILCGLAAIVGHIWTPYAGFRGGKGVGTAAGVFGAIAPIPVLAALIVFIVVVATTRYISAGSLCAAVVLPAVLIAQYRMTPDETSLVTVVAACAVGLLVIVRHRTNIRRIIAGTENRFGRTTGADPVDATVAESRS